MPNQSDTSTRVNLQLEQAIHAVLSDRPIAYHASLARALGSVTAGVLLSQFLYWQPRSRDPDGWFWKTQVDIADETALSRTETETARKVLVRAGVLEEKRRGVPAKMHFRINLTKVVELLSRTRERRQGSPSAARATASPSSEDHPDRQFAGFLQTRLRQTDNLDCGVPANQSAGISPSNSENTTETSSENTSQTTNSNTFEINSHKQNEMSSSFSRNEDLQFLESEVKTTRSASILLAVDQPRGFTPVAEVIKTRHKKTSQSLSDGSEAPHTPKTGSITRKPKNGSSESAKAGGRRGLADQATPDLAAVMSQVSDELYDDAARSSLGRAVRLWQQSKASEGNFIAAVYAARKIAKSRGDIEKRASGDAGEYGFRNRMPYFLRCLEDQLGLKQAD